MELLEKDLTDAILNAAFTVHQELGPGLLESAYEACLLFELQGRGLRIEQQKPIPLKYRGIHLDCGFRLDLLVESRVILEIKSVESLLPIHEAQLMTYLRLTGCRVGLLLNFNVKTFKDGIRRRVL